MDVLIRLCTLIFLVDVFVVKFQCRVMENTTSDGDGIDPWGTDTNSSSVQGPFPNEIFQLEAKPMSSSSVLVTWDLVGYVTREWYFDVFAGEQRIFTARIDAKTKKHMILNLKPGTSYYVQLESLTMNGHMIRANPLSFTTLPDSTRRGRSRTRTDILIHSTTVPSAEATVLTGSTRKITNGSNQYQPMETEPETSEESHNGMLKYILIGCGSFVGAVLLIFLVIAVFHRMQKHSDRFILQRNMKRTSLKKLTTNQEQDNDQEMERVTEGNKKEEKETTTQADTSRPRPPAFLAVSPGNVRGDVCSGVSWGSEFDVLEHGDNIYGNQVCPPTHSLHRSPTNPPPSVSRMDSTPTPDQHQDAIYGNTSITTTPSSPTPTPQRINHSSSLRSVPRSPPLHAMTSHTLPQNYANQNSSTNSSFAWNTRQGLNMVIKPQTSVTEQPPTYSNVIAHDQDDLYVNSQDISRATHGPPPIPRR